MLRAAPVSRQQSTRLPLRGALLHEHRVRRHCGRWVKAQVARARCIVIEKVVPERGAVDLVGPLHPLLGAGRASRNLVMRRHVPLQPLEPRLLAARDLLHSLDRRPQPELPVRHRRLEQVEARRHPVRAVLALQHHHRQRREGQTSHHHARERVELVLRAWLRVACSAAQKTLAFHATGPACAHSDTLFFVMIT